MSSIKEKIENLKALVTGNQQAAAIVDDLLAGASDTQKQADEAGLRKKDGETTKAEAAPVAEAKADDPPVAEAAAEAEDGADLTFIGDMTPDEFTTLMVSAMSQALAPLMEAMGQTTTAMAKAVDATGTATKEAKDGAAAAVAALDKRVKELEGDAPKPGGFRASTDPATTVKEPKVIPQQTENELQVLGDFWVRGPKQ